MGEWSTLKALRAFLDANEPRLVLFLVTFWNNQERAITYKELREAILAGEIDPEWLEQWQQDYSVFVTTYLQPLWLAAIDSAANDLQEWLKANNRTDVMDWFDPVADGIKEWVSQRAAEFVTNSSQEQMDAIRAVVQRAAVMEDMTVDKLARAIRPMVGLTKQQAVANMNYYQTLLRNGISETKARDLSIRYAARQHRYRGYNIARTELSFSFNKGADDGARQAQEYGVLGDLEKVWDAAEDERTCPICGALDGQRIAMNEEFDFPTKLAATNPGIRRTPPAHPSCRCGVKYVEVTDPVIKSLECIEEIEKYNPYHDARGRFTSANSASSFTIRTRAGYQQGQANRAIEREKERNQTERPSKKEWDHEIDAEEKRVLDMDPDERALYVYDNDGESQDVCVYAMENGKTDELVKNYFNIMRENGDYRAERPTTGQLSDKLSEDVNSGKYAGYQEARKDYIKQMSGQNDSEASATLKAFEEWFGGSWENADTKTLDKYIESDHVYNGKIYRGMKFDNDNFDEFMKNVSPGAEISMKRNSSWSSDENVARLFGQNASEDINSVIITCVKNKTSSPVDHLSTQGEGEILASSKARWTVLHNEIVKLPNGTQKAYITVVEKE